MYISVPKRKHKKCLYPLWSMQGVWMFTEAVSVKNGVKNLYDGFRMVKSENRKKRCTRARHEGRALSSYQLR